MTKKTTKLSLVNKTENQPQGKTYKDLEQERKGWRITRQEARARVHALRIELDSYLEQLEAVPFDLPSGDVSSPRCLDGARKHIVEIVADFNPLIDGLFRRCDSVAEKHGAHEELDYNAELFNLRMHTAETGFYIGVLAGALFSGASKETVDRFERGLLFALTANNQIVKE